MGILNEFLYLLIDVVLVQWFGWVLFLSALIYFLYWLKRDANRNAYTSSVKQIFLEVKVDPLNEKSPLAMEQIFAAMHAIHTNFTWGEDFAGKVVLWMSCEMVSLGGKVSYIFRLPERYRNLFESAMFAQYPKAEISEVEDYIRNLPYHYVPEEANFEFWGTQWNKKKENAYPIRTFGQVDSFEHSAQETFVDPLSNVIEVMSNTQPYELISYQLVIRPVNDDWKENTKYLVDKLKGVPSKHEEGWFEAIFLGIPRLIGDALVGFFTGPPEEKKPTRILEEPPSLMLHKTDIEKLIINSIERAVAKVTYESRVRTLYLTPKGKMNKARISEIVGAFRNFDDVNLNGLKPDIGHSWTEGPAFKLSERLEKPYTDMAKITRQREFLHAFLPRSSWKGTGKQIMNTEELATIFHFPQTQHARISQVEQVQAGKAAPPMDLPIK